MRLDRLITLSLAQPLRRIGNHGAKRIPILMYHSISDDPEPGVAHYYRTNTGPARFREHMAFLAEQGYRGVDLPTGLDALGVCPASRGGDSRRVVIVTFDDGFKDFYTAAYPVLRDYGFSATMFLATAFIKNVRQSFMGRECLTWPEVSDLRKCGMHFGSHTVNHLHLIDLAWTAVEREVRDSKTEIEQHLNEAIDSFAHPYAFPQADRKYAQTLQRLLAEGGYRCCATTEIGRVQVGDDLYRLKRLPVNSSDDLKLFQAKLEGSYDWLGHPQAISKQIKHRMFGRGDSPRDEVVVRS